MDLREFFIAVGGLALTGYLIRKFNAIRIRYHDLDIVLLSGPPPRPTERDPERGQPAIED